MTTLNEQEHSKALREAIQRYERQGFHVVVEPAGEDAPPFLQGFRPDVMAIAPDGKSGVIVEFASGTGTRKADYLSRLAARFAHQRDWKLEVITLPSEEHEPYADVASTRDLADQLAQAKDLIHREREKAGFLLLWSTIEGALRAYVQRRKLREPTASAIELAKVLVSEGELDTEDYRKLRDAFELRSRWAHGLRAPIVGTEAVIGDSIEIADNLLEKVRKIEG